MAVTAPHWRLAALAGFVAAIWFALPAQAAPPATTPPELQSARRARSFRGPMFSRPSRGRACRSRRYRRPILTSYWPLKLREDHIKPAARISDEAFLAASASILLASCRHRSN